MASLSIRSLSLSLTLSLSHTHTFNKNTNCHIKHTRAPAQAAHTWSYSLCHSPTHTHSHTHSHTQSGRALLVFPLTHGNRFRCSSTPRLSGLTFHWKQITLFLSRSLANTHTHTTHTYTHTSFPPPALSFHALSSSHSIFSPLFILVSDLPLISLPWVLSSSSPSLSPPSFYFHPFSPFSITSSFFTLLQSLFFTQWHLCHTCHTYIEY